MGGNVRIAKGERAREVTVFGGNVDIEGETTGDVIVFGGNVRVHEGARVHGDAFGLRRHAQARAGPRGVDGDVESAIGGTASIATLGRRSAATSRARARTRATRRTTRGRSPVARAGHSVMEGVRMGAVLFVIGTMLLALAGRRMDALRVEAAARPMRSIALGVLYGSSAACSCSSPCA